MPHTTFTASDPRQRTDLQIVDHDTRGLTIIVRSDAGAELRAHVADADELLDALAGPQECSECQALERELEDAVAERDSLREDIRRLLASAPSNTERAAVART